MMMRTTGPMRVPLGGVVVRASLAMFMCVPLGGVVVRAAFAMLMRVPLGGVVVRASLAMHMVMGNLRTLSIH